MSSNAVDAMRFFAQCSECQSGENFKQARANGSHVGLKPVLFVTQPKLRTVCLHVLRQFHRLHFLLCQVINVTAINVVPVLTLVLCVWCVVSSLVLLSCLSRVSLSSFPLLSSNFVSLFIFTSLHLCLSSSLLLASPCFCVVLLCCAVLLCVAVCGCVCVCVCWV